jgi:hypothetical protein
MAYAFSNIDNYVESIMKYIQTTDLIENRAPEVITIKAMDMSVGQMSKRRKTAGGRVDKDTGEEIDVEGLDRKGNKLTHKMPIEITISAQTDDPMELLEEAWGTSMWNVEIKISPKARRTVGNCFYMQVFIPARPVNVAGTRTSRRRLAGTPAAAATGNPDGVVVSWLNQIMINPISHEQITPNQCMAGDLPNYQWGTLFMNLYEAFTIQFAKATHMPVVGGLVDDAFVNYCHGPVVFSDFRRLNGSDPWYESFGFYMANELEYKNALTNRYSNSLAHTSVMEHYRDYKQELEACRESAPDPNESMNVCKTFGLTCDNSSSCPGPSCMKHRELYSYIGKQIIQNNEQACQWISNFPPVKSSCITHFNRKFNSQTIRIGDELFAVRLKFYTVAENSLYA